MKLWRRAVGALKDRNSLWIAAISRRRSKHDHPDHEASIIQATSHDERTIDYKNTQRVFAFIRTSPVHLLPFMRTLSRRLSRTRSPVVAIKGLMLLHGVLCTHVPASYNIGRLPFDLSGFTSSSSNTDHRWAYTAFVRSYFSFLDQKSVLLSIQFHCSKSEANEDCTIRRQLMKVQKWQGLLDMLLDVHPQVRGMKEAVVVLEAMDCVVIEVFDVYSKICEGIAEALARVYAAGGRAEAAMALEVLNTATRQGEELADYFEMCRAIGVVNATECPKVERIPDEDIIELQRIINGVLATHGDRRHCTDHPAEEEKAIVVVQEERGRADVDHHRGDSGSTRLRTIITDKWEVFNDDLNVKIGNLIDVSDDEGVHQKTAMETSIVPASDQQYYAFDRNDHMNIKFLPS